MLRQLVLIVAVLAVFSTAYSALLVDCLFGQVKLFGTPDASSTPFFSQSAGYTTPNFNVTTEFNFPDHVAYMNVTRVNDLQTTFMYSVNGGPLTTKIFPGTTDYPELYTLATFTDGTTQCTVFNWIDLNISQSHTTPFTEENCNYYFGFWITTTNPAVCGDPQFVGLRGQRFQIHGIDGAIYNLISTETYSINSQFRFLTGPRPCPIMPTTGKKSLACWSHDGSYLENVAFTTVEGDKFIAQSGSADSGFSKVAFNDRELIVGDAVTFAQGSIILNSTHEVTLTIGVFHIEIENVDGFVNLRRVRVAPQDLKVLAAGEGTHGLLGQTWQNKRYSGKVPEIQGAPDDYVIESDDIFGNDFIFSRMVKSQ